MNSTEFFKILNDFGVSLPVHLKQPWERIYKEIEAQANEITSLHASRLKDTQSANHVAKENGRLKRRIDVLLKQRNAYIGLAGFLEEEQKRADERAAKMEEG